MKCPKCGYENKDNARYCGLCYEPLSKKPAETSPEQETPPVIPSKKSSLITGIAARVVLILLAVLLAASLYRALNKYGWNRYTSKINSNGITLCSDLPAGQAAMYQASCIIFRAYFNEHVLPVTARRIKVYLMKDPRDFIQFCRKINYYGSPYGYFSKELNLMVINYSSGAGTLYHEFTHALLSESGIDPPEWLDEGLALLYEKVIGYYENENSSQLTFGYLSPWRFERTKELLSRGLLRLDRLSADQTVGWALALYVHRQGKMKQFLASYGKQRDLNAALREVFGEDADEFEIKWKHWLTELPLDENAYLAKDAYIFGTKTAFEEFLSNHNATWYPQENLYKAAPK
jgi:hypothetical protein